MRVNQNYVSDTTVKYMETLKIENNLSQSLNPSFLQENTTFGKNASFSVKGGMVIGKRKTKQAHQTNIQPLNRQ